MGNWFTLVHELAHVPDGNGVHQLSPGHVDFYYLNMGQEYTKLESVGWR